MHKIKFILPFIALTLLLSCKSEKKVTAYNDLYQEKPVSILIAPVQDNAKHINPKTTQDKNNE